MSEIKALESAREHVSVYAADCDQVWMLGLLDEIQAEVDSRFMELPVDADGVPIHVGDSIRRGYENPVEVREILLCERRGASVGTSDGGLWWGGAFNECRHVKPRTLEDVLLDMLGSYYRKLTGSWATLTTDEELASGYAAEIRELLGKAGD